MSEIPATVVVVAAAVMMIVTSNSELRHPFPQKISLFRRLRNFLKQRREAICGNSHHYRLRYTSIF